MIFIKNKYRKTVLMTFTKKAAGELSIRLNNEFISKAENGVDDIDYWKMALSSLDYL